MGVVAIPLMVWNGMNLTDAIGALLPNVLAQTAIGCWRHRTLLPWKAMMPVIIWRFLSLPLGIALLSVVANQGRATTQGLLGATLIGILAMQQWRPASSTCPGPIAAAAAGITSGILAGLIGMGGPSLVVWVMSQDWSPQRQRASLWLAFLTVTPFQIAAMLFTFGSDWVPPLLVGMASVPITWFVSAHAAQWADGWSRERLRWGMRLFLLLIAVHLVYEYVSG